MAFKNFIRVINHERELYDILNPQVDDLVYSAQGKMFIRTKDRWVLIEATSRGTLNKVVCDYCGSTLYDFFKPNCPNCGAPLKGD